MKYARLFPFVFVICICTIFIPKTVHAKSITIGNNNNDISWDNLDVLDKTLSAGDTIIILAPPENTGEKYVLNITHNNVTIQSEEGLEISGVSIHTNNIDSITLKDIKLYAPEGMEALKISSDNPFSYRYTPNARHQTEYSDLSPVTIRIEGDVKLICGNSDIPTVSDGGTAIHAANSIIIEGSGQLEVIGGFGTSTGGDAITSIGNITLKANVTGTGGSVPAQYSETRWSQGGEGINSATDIHVYSNCIFYGGQPGGNGLRAERYLNIYENGSVSAEGADDDILGGFGAYCYGGANIEGTGDFDGGDGQYGGGDGLYVYHEDLNVSGILNSWGGSALREAPDEDDPMPGGHGIWVNTGNINFFGPVTAVGGKSAAGVGGVGVVTLRNGINLYNVLNATGGDGKYGIVSYGAGVYFENLDNSLIFHSAEARVAIINGENYRPVYTGLSLKKGNEVQNLLWNAPDNILSGGFSESRVFAAGKKYTIALDSGATENNPEFTFTDISGHWAENIVIKAAKDGIIAGVGNNRFDPDRIITRAEFIHLVNKVSKLYAEIDGDAFENIDGYVDVNKDDWFYESVMTLKSAGLLDGVFGVNYLDPALHMSREQMACIIANLLKYRNVETGTVDIKSLFDDYERITPAYTEAVEDVVSLKIMSGVGAGGFSPDGITTRAQAATVLLNAMEYLVLQ